MFEIIIKVIEKEQGEHRAISKAISDALEPFDGVLKIATRDKDDEGNVTYSNEIWQIGEKPVDESEWKKIDYIKSKVE